VPVAQLLEARQPLGLRRLAAAPVQLEPVKHQRLGRRVDVGAGEGRVLEHGGGLLRRDARQQPEGLGRDACEDEGLDHLQHELEPALHVAQLVLGLELLALRARQPLLGAVAHRGGGVLLGAHLHKVLQAEQVLRLERGEHRAVRAQEGHQAVVRGVQVA